MVARVGRVVSADQAEAKLRIVEKSPWRANEIRG
jgi:hypothetical protein